MTPIAYVSGASAVLAAALTVTCWYFPASAQQQTVAPVCGSEEIARGTVASVGNGRTFTLADGREVRLTGIEVPPAPSLQDSSAAKSALDALAGGDEVVLRRAE